MRIFANLLVVLSLQALPVGASQSHTERYLRDNHPIRHWSMLDILAEVQRLQALSCSNLAQELLDDAKKYKGADDAQP